MPISRVGATNGTVAADATTVTVTRTVTAGNGGILIIGDRGTAALTVSTVSDGTNTWLQAPGIAAGIAAASGDLWYCKSFAASASITVTVTWAAGASGTGALTLIEVTGQDTVTFFDTGISTSAFTASCASGNTAANLAQSNEFVIGAVCGNGNHTFSSPAFSPNGTITTETVANSTGSHACQVAAFDMVGGTGGATESFTVTDSVSTNTVTICAAFLPAAATAGSPVRQWVVAPVPQRARRAVIVTLRLVPAARPVPVAVRVAAPPPRPKPRSVVIGPRSLLASPVPPVPGKPVLIAPLPFRIRPRGRAVVVQFILVPAARPVPVAGRTVIPPPRPKPRGVVQFIPVRTGIPRAAAIIDDGDAPWHIRIRRRRT